MAARASWKGFLNLSLVSVPVKAYSANNSGGQIRLNQLHAECNSRINLKTVCPNCGEVGRNDIVKGYEYAKDQYVVIDLDELEKLRSHDATKAIRIDTFLRPDQLDPVYYSDTNYFLVPDGAAGQKPYSLLMTAMDQMGVVCVARVVLHNKEQLVLVRPLDGLLCMNVLKYSTQIKSPSAFHDEIADTELSDDEFSLAKTLIEESTSEEFALENYTDQYTAKLNELIEAKVSGKEIVAAPAVESTQVINLMDALRASVSQAKGAGATKKSAAVKTSDSTPRKAAKAKKKSTAKKALADQLANPNKKAAKEKKTG